VGLAVSLYYAWIIAPVVYTNASPASLSDSYRTEYVALIGQSYLTTGNWDIAEQRLQALAEPDLAQAVATLLEQAIREQQPDRTIRALAALGQALGVSDRAVALFAPTPATAVPPTLTPTATSDLPVPTPTATATVTETAVPATARATTAPATATPQPNYRLLNQEPLCDDLPPRIEVVTLNTLLDPQPGTAVLVTWDGGEDQFFTGFKPELGDGAGDFSMEPDVSYTVVLPAGSQPVSGLRAEPCDDGTIGSWRLTFQNLGQDGGN
jgi:hypothetical protein